MAKLIERVCVVVCITGAGFLGSVAVAVIVVASFN